MLRSIFAKVTLTGILLLTASLPASAATNSSTFIEDGILKTETETGIEGMVTSVSSPSRLLALGKHVRYPAEGGTWEYGFWDVYVRSYYTVNKKHGSSVELNGNLVRSIDTASGKTSIAEKWALNLPGNNDKYYYRIVN